MAHDGQIAIETPVLAGLIDLTREALGPVDGILARAKEVLRADVTQDGRVSGALIDAHQTAAHGLAWLATYAESLHQMQAWADKLDAEGDFGELEQLIHQIAFGEYLWQIYGGIQMNQGEVVRLQDLGLSQEDQRGLMAPAVMTLCNAGNTQPARLRLVELMQDQGGTIVGRSGLDEELEMIREQFRRYAIEKVEPYAHEWHLKDELIPMETIGELAEMGVFGLTIPEEHGGLGFSKASM
ncbi:MAG: acyl-CoA dehydrogenase family protein, partial [Pseudomonadota bacterium]